MRKVTTMENHVLDELKDYLARHPGGSASSRQIADRLDVPKVGGKVWLRVQVYRAFRRLEKRGLVQRAQGVKSTRWKLPAQA